MVGSFLDKATDLFGRRFLLTAWGPAFAVFVLGFVPVALYLGIDRLAGLWSDFDGPTKITLGFVALLTLTASAYVVQALPIVRLFEGYNAPLAGIGRWRQSVRAQRLNSDNQPFWRRKRNEWYHAYPTKDLLPSRLGNVFRSAETYPFVTYGLDGVIWWPRLVPHVDKELRATIDEALLPVVALLNAVALLLLVTFANAGWMVVADLDVGWVLLVYAVGVALAGLAYRAAIQQAVEYGQWVRAAFDLHRFAILDQLHIKRPENPVAERELWHWLEGWLYDFTRPLPPTPGALQPGTPRHDEILNYNKSYPANAVAFRYEATPTGGTTAAAGPGGETPEDGDEEAGGGNG